MRRFLVFIGLMVCMVVTLAWAGPAERFVRVYSVSAAKGADLEIVPTYLGSAFRPNKLVVMFAPENATNACTVMIYIPHNTGPDTATDSIPIYVTVRGSSGTQWLEYYGPMSDTMRVYGTANTNLSAICYGW